MGRRIRSSRNGGRGRSGTQVTAPSGRGKEGLETARAPPSSASAAPASRLKTSTLKQARQLTNGHAASARPRKPCLRRGRRGWRAKPPGMRDAPSPPQNLGGEAFACAGASVGRPSPPSEPRRRPRPAPQKPVAWTPSCKPLHSTRSGDASRERPPAPQQVRARARGEPGPRGTTRGWQEGPSATRDGRAGRSASRFSEFAAHGSEPSGLSREPKRGPKGDSARLSAPPPPKGLRRRPVKRSRFSQVGRKRLILRPRAGSAQIKMSMFLTIDASARHR